jgi:hypothetical protein
MERITGRKDPSGKYNDPAKRGPVNPISFGDVSLPPMTLEPTPKPEPVPLAQKRGILNKAKKTWEEKILAMGLIRYRPADDAPEAEATENPQNASITVPICLRL